MPFAKTSLIERQPFTLIPKTLCVFSFEEIKIIRNKKAFNKDLNDHFLSKLKEIKLLQNVLLTVPAYSKEYILSPIYVTYFSSYQYCTADYCRKYLLCLTVSA